MLIKCMLLSGLFASVTSYQINLFDSSASTIPPISHSNMTQLLELCYSEASNPIIMTTNLVGTIQKNLIHTFKSPIFLINEDFISKNIQLYYRNHPLYILSVNSIGQLKSLLMELKSSPVWNIKSTFFIIGNTNKSCRNSGAILRFLWKFELLSSFVVCSKTNNRTMLYTYNPYTKRPIPSWTVVKKTDNPDQRWTLHKRRFQSDPKICETLKFDKTKHMDGYPAKIVTAFSYNELLRCCVFPSLNMTQDVLYYDESQKLYKISDLLAEGEQDITTGLYSDYLISDPADTVPVPYELSYVIVTQKRTFMSSIREIAVLLDFKTAFAIIFVIFFIFVVIMINNNYQIVSAFLDVFKLLLSMGMDVAFDRLSMKILFFTASFFMFAFEPEIESQLFALLARPQSYTIENLKDLYNHKYHVYYNYLKHEYLIDEKLWTTVEDKKYLHPVPTTYPDDCLELAAKNNTVACVFQAELTVKKAIKKNLFISKKFIYKENYFIWSRKDWALKDRVHKKLLNVVESGYRDDIVRHQIRNPLKKEKAKARIEKIDEYDEINEDNLYYFYLFFIFCQVFAVFVFIIEHLIARLRR